MEWRKRCWSTSISAARGTAQPWVLPKGRDGGMVARLIEWIVNAATVTALD